MCRLYGFRSTEPSRVGCTLVSAQNALMLQSKADQSGKAHPDGWGIATYHQDLESIERRALPAYDDLHFSSTAEKTVGETVVAHVRRASVGKPALENTHPFTLDRWTFAHNGTLHAFDRLRKVIEHETDDEFQEHRRGETDSEAIFLWLLTHVKEKGIPSTERCGDVGLLRDVVARAILTLDARSREAGETRAATLNFILTDGHAMVASCWKKPLCWLLQEGVRTCEVCGTQHVDHQPGQGYRAFAVASEAISHEHWQTVPEGTIVSIDDDLQPRFDPIQPHANL